MPDDDLIASVIFLRQEHARLMADRRALIADLLKIAEQNRQLARAAWAKGKRLSDSWSDPRPAH